MHYLPVKTCPRCLEEYDVVSGECECSPEEVD
jgi:hypothetical protein